MNKKTTKLMATALTATMGAGMATQLVQAAEVTPYEAALEAVITMEKDPSGANIDKAYNAVKALKAGAQKDALNKRVEKVAAPHHKAVYDIMVTARTNKDLKTIGDARKAVAGMAKIFIKDAYTWSSELDNFTIEYQKTVVDTLNAIANGKEEVKQATINELREIIVGLELQRSNEGLLKLVLDYSATLDKVQMDYVNEVLAEVNAATTEAKLTVAKAKYNDLLTMKDEALKAAVQSNIGAVIATKEAELSTPKVESISAINAKEVEVKFNKAVDVTTAETVGNYDFSEIVGSAIGANPTDAAVQADGKTVVLTLGTAIISETTFTTTVSGVKVKGSDYDYFKTFAKSTKFKDTVAPNSLGVTSLTNGTASTSLTVTFSEPVASATFKVNGSYKSGVIAADGYSATISGLSLDASKAHTLEVLNLTDFASNVTSFESKSFNVTKDVANPNISVSTRSDNQLLLSFDKKMNASTVNATNVKVKNELLNDLVVSGFTPADSTGKNFIVDLPAGLYSSKDSRTLTVLLNDSVTDSLGNKLPTQFKNVTISKDTSAPTVSNVTFAKNPVSGNVDKVVVEFSEGLAASVGGYATGGITVIGPNGVDVTTGFFASNTVAVAKGATKVEIPLSAPVQSGKYTLYLPGGFVTDIAQDANNSVASTQVVDFGTSTSGEFKITQLALGQTPSNTTNVITVNYGTVVKGGAQAGSATDVNNYTLNGMPLPTGTLITLNAALNTATITVPDEAISTTDTAAVLRITGVQNSAGTVINPFVGTVAVTDSKAPVLSTAVLNTNGTFTAGFGETLNVAALLSDFDVAVNGKAVNASQITFTAAVGADAGKYVFAVNGLVSDNGTVGDTTDDFLYIDANNDGAYVATDDIKVTGAVATAGVVDLNSAAISSVKLSTKAAGPLTGADTAGNTLKINVSKIVK